MRKDNSIGESLSMFDFYRNKTSIKNTSLEYLELSEKATKALEKYGINTIGRLLVLTSNDLYDILNGYDSDICIEVFQKTHDKELLFLDELKDIDFYNQARRNFILHNSELLAKLYNSSVGIFKFDTMLYPKLFENNIYIVNDLLSLSVDEIKKLRGIDPKDIKTILKIVHDTGLVFRQEKVKKEYSSKTKNDYIKENNKIKRRTDKKKELLEKCQELKQEKEKLLKEERILDAKILKVMKQLEMLMEKSNEKRK